MWPTVVVWILLLLFIWYVLSSLCELNSRLNCVDTAYVEFVNYTRAVLQTLTDSPIQYVTPCRPSSEQNTNHKKHCS